MNLLKTLNLPEGKAICYSGYRESQSHDSGIYPSYKDVYEDLLILQNNWTYLRLYFI